MNCVSCNLKSCRTAQSCGMESFDRHELRDRYHEPETQRMLQSAAKLVDGGRAGELSRLEELMELIPAMGYEKPSLAYCYGMEKQAQTMVKHFRSRGIPLMGVSCTAGAHRQDELNNASNLPGVSCNPLSQATQLNEQGADLAILFGQCMGHDILFTREFKGDVTTFVVKDRVHGHCPLKALEGL